MTLRAESGTSVLDPKRLRWLWVRELNLAVALAVTVLVVISSVQFLRSGASPR